nr:hypothetical protein [Tanacetum cinerariifolium]
VYSLDDLKEVQCYICKCFGHLCCVNYGEGPSEVSCYRCGLLGHSGLECASVTARAHAETTDTGSPNAPNTCCKCGEDGHRARKCPKFVKESLLKDDKDHVGIKSAPPDLDEAHKKKETQNGDSPSSQPKRRGGWIDENLGDFFKGTPSPSDGNNYRCKNSFHEKYGAKDYDSGFQFEPSGSDEYQHKFSASRFGNASDNAKKEHS